MSAGSAACLSPSNATAADAGSDGLQLIVQDRAGHTAELDAIPTRPQIAITTREPIAWQAEHDPPVLLLQGEADAELAADLARAPLTAASSARQITALLRSEGDRLWLMPSAPLAKGQRYTLAVAGYARFEHGDHVTQNEQAWTRELTVSDAAGNGASVTASWPADGSTGVATNLSFAALTLDGALSSDTDNVWLQDEAGDAVPAQVTRFECDELVTDADSCIQLVPSGFLAPNHRYELHTGSGLLDAHGEPVATFVSSFVTGAGVDRKRPSWLPAGCAPDERATAVGCALSDDASVTLRATTDEAVRFVVRDAAERTALLAPAGNATFRRHQLQAGERVTFDVSAYDAAGNENHAPIELATLTDLPKLSIVEVRADPLGPEPAQEFVELLNYGDDAVALTGFSLVDDAEASGTPFETDAIVYPHSRVLLVPDDFDAGSALDVPPLPGTTLVRVGASLAKSGLGNAGEPLYLRDPEGRRVSAAPATPAPKAGICIVRIASDMRSGEPGSFGYDAGGGCTPGR